MSPCAPALPPPDLARALERLADALAWPLILLHDQGQLRYVNGAAQALLNAGVPLQLTVLGRLQPSSASYRTDFALALQAAAAGQTVSLRWPGRPGGHAATLRPLAARPGEAPLLLLRLSLPQPLAAGCDLGAVAQMLGLTPAETRVLHGLARGQGATQMAEELGIASSTARRHVRGLLRKSGTPRVAALLMALGRLPPVVPAFGLGK